MGMKRCSKCGNELNISEFGTSRGKSNAACKECRNKQRRERYSQNHEKELSWKRGWDERNHEKNNAKMAERLREDRINMGNAYIRMLIRRTSPLYRGEIITPDVIAKKRNELAAKRAKRNAQKSRQKAALGQ